MTVGPFSVVLVCAHSFIALVFTFHSMHRNHGRTLIGLGICIACYDGAYVRAMYLLLLREAHACTSFSNKDSVLVTKYVFFHRYIYMYMYIYTSIYDHERESCSIATANCNICKIVSQLWPYRVTLVLYHKCTQTHD